MIFQSVKCVVAFSGEYHPVKVNLVWPKDKWRVNKEDYYCTDMHETEGYLKVSWAPNQSHCSWFSLWYLDLDSQDISFDISVYMLKLKMAETENNI